MKFLLFTLFVLPFSSIASFSDKKVDLAFMQKLFKNRDTSISRGWYPNLTAIDIMDFVKEDKRKLQQYTNFEKKMISWVNFLDASENNDLFSSKMVKWREKNESCSHLILIKEIEKEMKKYDEKTQAMFFFLFPFRPQSLFSNGAFFYLRPAEVEGTRSFDSGSFETYHYSEHMNAITRNLTWLMRFVSDSRPDMVEFNINEAIKKCDRLPTQEDIFPNWDMEEIHHLMGLSNEEELKEQLDLFMLSAWSPEMNFEYGYRSALALYPLLGVEFNNREKTPEFMKTYFDSMVRIYDRSKAVDEKLCKSLNAPLSLASMLGFDVDPMKKEYSLFSVKDFEKWMEIKSSINVASIYEIKECLGTLRYLDNVWGGSTILPHPNNSIMRFDESRYMGKTDVELFYYPKWKTNICMKSKLKNTKGKRSVKKSKVTGRLGCW